MDWKNYPQKISTPFDIFKTIALLFLCLGFQLTHAQNTCATALPITAGTTIVDAIDGVNITNNCSNAGMAEWYTYTPTENHSVTVTSDLLVNICKDTHFSVYTGSCAGFVCYTSDDDNGTIACNNGNASSYLSTKTFDVYAGTTYYISWDNRWSEEGFEFQLIEAPYFPSPCGVATPITAGITTVNAIDGGNVTTTCSSATMGKWYTYTPTQNYHVVVSSDLVANICKDTNFSVYTGSCSGGLTCVASDDNAGIIACNLENTNSFLSKKAFDVNAGTTYFIAWDNKWSAAGFDFELTEAPIIVPVNFTSQTIANVSGSAYNMCIVDMNGDHKDDIVSLSNSNLRVNYQQTGGTFTFTDYTVPGGTQMPSWSIAAGDLNKDGYNDLLIGGSGGISLWSSNSTGTAYSNLTPGQYIFCQRTNFVDINNDGNLDVFSCHDVNPNVYYLNDGAGNYTYYQSGISPGAYSLGITPSGGNYASLWTDYDNDGDVDMFISKCSGPPCELHRNDGNGVFTDVSALAQINVSPITTWSSAIADFDNDGDMDILIGSNGGVTHKLFRNNLDTTNSIEEAFTNITAGSGWDTDGTTNRDYLAYDFDNDGFVDVLGSSNKIMFNKGDGTFERTNYPSGLSIGAVGDLNGDGFLDILNGTTVRYAVPNGNNWITIALDGIASNSNGIGARIEIYGAWGKQIRDIRSGEGFGYMCTLDAHFGIGAATSIDKVVIKWPSGDVDTILNPEIDHKLTVSEGSFPLKVEQMDSNDFTLFPNPTSDIINIKANSAAADIKSAQVFDLTGKLVLDSAVINNTVTVKSLATGSYIINLKDADGRTFAKKFIKK
ncbi:MAG TPA: FG-GAP-like repeat-containing protein [Flavobacterium sp.]|nr:FG-GAP-like repeat-containing protein [Flavobacterium sp.]